MRIDHPGHGGAPLAEVRDVGDLAARVLATVGDGSFSFVGLSLGGAVGMQLALTAPERVERLVLACTAARFGEPEQWRERAALVRAEGLEAIVDAVLGALVHAAVRRRRARTGTCCSRSTRRATRAAARRSPAGTSAARWPPFARRRS